MTAALDFEKFAPAVRTQIGLVLAGLEAVLLERPSEWARRVELPRRRRRRPLSRLFLWPPLAAASLALGWALALASH